MRAATLSYFRPALLALMLMGSVVTSESTTAHATTNAERPAPELIAQVWQAARIDQLSQSMVDNILAGVSEHPDVKKLSPEKRDHVLELYRRRASADRFSDRIRTRLEIADAPALRALIDVTRSEVAARAFQHELAFKPVAPALMLEHALSVRDTPEGMERLDIIERLDDAIGVTEMSVGVAAASVWGTSVAMREFEQPRSTLTSDDMERAMVDFIARVRPFQRQQIQITYLWLYRNMPLADLRDYVALQEAAPVQALQRSLVQALGEEMIALQRDVTRDVVRGLRGGGERAA